MKRCRLPAAIAALVAASASPLQAQWGPVPVTARPSARTGALMTYDLSGARTLLYGGNGTGEFWSLANGTWTELTGIAVPPARIHANWSTFPLTGETVLYGGFGGGQFALDETWVWNGSAWQQQQPTVTPGGIARHGMAHDDARFVTVLFGGRHNSWIPNSVLQQTWEFDGSTWTQVVTPVSPPGRADAGMAWHPGLYKVMVFGGQNSAGGSLGDTWTYDGAAWTEINTTGVRPPARIGGVLVPVLSRGICVLFGGRDPVTMAIFNDTWEHDGVDWRKVDNVYGGVYPARDDAAVAHDFVRDRLVLFGGEIANGALQDDTWEYGAHWQPFGTGCAGTGGVPVLSGGGLPRLGQTATAVVSNLPPSSSLAFMAIGLSRTQWAFGSLPTLLTFLGMPNCRAYSSADLFVGIPAANGAATWSFAIPPQPDLVGVAFYLQGVSPDPGVNAQGLTVSNAATLVVGN